MTLLLTHFPIGKAMSILTQLRKLEKDLTGYKTQRETALKSYQDLYPEYKTAVTAAKEMGTQVADSYNTYARLYNESLGVQRLVQQAATERNELSGLVQSARDEYKLRKEILGAFNFGSGPPQDVIDAYVQSQRNLIQISSDLTRYDEQTYNPTVQAYENFASTSGMDVAKTKYEELNTKYKDLQSVYKGLEENLSVYTSQMEEATKQAQALGQQIPGLQQSLKVEQDPRKRETRIGYGRSLMTSGTKRRSSVR